MRLVTVATRSEGYFPYLLESCKKHNISLDILGWGEKWQGFTWRLHLLKEWLQSLDKDEVVCFIDGFDVIVLQPVEVLEYRFKKIKESHPNVKIISAYENQCWYLKWLTLVIFGTCNNMFINAGTYIGYAKDILQVIEYNMQINPAFNADDQQLLLTYCRNNPSNVYIDIDKRLFLTKINPLFDISKVIIHNINVYDPCILHAPCATNLNEVLKSLGYTMTKQEEYEINEYIKKTITQKVMHYSSMYIQIIICIVCICIVLLIILRVRNQTCFK